MKHEELFEIRNFQLDGADETDWVWQKIDGGHDGGAHIGPMKDWNATHSERFFAHTPGMNVCVTAGGNHGMYVRAYSNLFRQVFAFEPEWLCFHAMVRNSLRENVFCFRAALGAEPGMCDVILTPNPQNTGMHTVVVKKGGSVPVMTIDGLALEACDLIQLDVEGFEKEIVIGAAETINKYSPTLILEDANKELKEFVQDEFRYREVGRSVSDTIFRKVI